MVYRARQVSTERIVALKIMRSPWEDHGESTKRFMREIRIQTRLNHPNLVKIIEGGIHENVRFLATELIEGGTLRNLCTAAEDSSNGDATNKGGMEESKVSGLVENIAAGLANLHEQGIVHRDLKPCNILITRSGIAKISDFGLSRGDHDTAMTRANQIVGTINYLAPEVLSGQSHAPPTDLFALGLITYELLTGTLPFRGRNIPEWIQLITECKPDPLSKRSPKCSAGLARLTMQLLRKVPEERPTASEVLSSLRGINPEEVQLASPLLAVAEALPRATLAPRVVTNAADSPSASSVSAGESPAPKEELSPRDLARLFEGYRFVRVLGKGGMGVVYEAVRSGSGERVAIKLIRPDILAHPTAVARFQREAKVLAGLMSTRIVRLLDSGCKGQWPYLVTEFLKGEDLAVRLKNQGPIRFVEGMSIFRAVAEGLAELHGHGIVHRDLKPSNIFITRSGSPRILDLGVSRQEGLTTLTTKGAFLGTLLYAPPEMLEGQAATSASDIFQFGAIFYEAFTGRRDFRSEDAAEHLVSRLSGQRAAASSAQSVTDVFRQCMRVDPGERYPNGAALFRALHGLEAGPRSRESVPGNGKKILSWLRRGIHAGSWILVILLVLATAITLMLLPELMRRTGL